MDPVQFSPGHSLPSNTEISSNTHDQSTDDDNDTETQKRWYKPVGRAARIMI